MAPGDPLPRSASAGALLAPYVGCHVRNTLAITRAATITNVIAAVQTTVNLPISVPTIKASGTITECLGWLQSKAVWVGLVWHKWRGGRHVGPTGET